MTIEMVAPTIVRFSMQHSVASGRTADMIVDISLDEFSETRHDAVAILVPYVCGIWQDKLAAFMPAGSNYVGSRWIDLDSIGGTSGFQGPIAGKPVHGAGGVTWTPPSVSMLVHKQCLHNRNQRNGRMFVPAVDEGSVDDGGLLSGSFISLWQPRLDALLSALNTIPAGTTWTTAWRVVHVTGHTGTPVPGHPNGLPNAWSSSDIDSLTIDGRAATQRRRLRA